MSELDLLRKIADLEARLARLESAGAPYTTTSAGAMTTPALNVGSATGAATGGVFTQASANNQYVLRFNDTSGNNRAGYQYQSDGTYDADLRNASGTTTIGLDGSAGTISLSGGLNVGSATGATTGQVISSGEGRFQDAVEFGYYNSRAFVQGYKRSTAAYLAIDFYTGSGGPQATLDSSALSLKGGINLGTATTAPAGGLALQDGITAPAATAGAAKIYVDTADGDLKVIFGDGTIKTIATDT